MLRVAWRSLRAHTSRLLLSTFAVVIGIAFVAGSFVFTDTLKATFTDLFGDVGSDVLVEPVRNVDSFVEDASVTLPASVVAEIEAVDGVDRALGGVFIQGVAILDDENEVIGTPGAPNFASDWSDDPDLSPLSLADGRGPENENEIAVDTQTAEAGDLELGQEVRVLTPGPVLTKTLVGVFKFGDSGNMAGASLTAFDSATAQELFTAPGEFTQVDVVAADGVTEEELAERIRAVLPADVATVSTGQEAADAAASDINEGFAFLDYLFGAFGAIALIVGTFLIVNTFTMLVASRARELALLRALGASKRQVSTSLLVEAVVVGLVGATFGLLAGLGIAVGLMALVGAFGLDLPDHGLVIASRTVITAYVVGVLVTVVAAWFPARRASKLPPVAAMSDTVVFPAKSLRRRTIAGAVLTLLGLVALLLGITADDVESGALLVGLGALLTIVGFAVVAPVLVGPLVALIGWPVRRFSPLNGRLAVDNARRNRARTAGTASALMIGLAVVTMFGIVGASVKASVDDVLEGAIASDFIVQPAGFAGGGISPNALVGLADVEGVQSLTEINTIPARVDGSEQRIAAITADSAEDAVKADFAAGSWDDLGPNTFALDADAVADRDLAVGDTVEFVFAASEVELQLAVVYSVDAVGGFMISTELASDLGLATEGSQAYVKLAPGFSGAEVRPDLEAAIADYPNIELMDLTELADMARTGIDQILSLLYLLLGISIIIAILGIVNTLALSVIERTREIGLLRAVGMSRKQVKRMVRWEAVIIAIMGATLGVALGVLLGVSLQRVLAGEGLNTLSIPWGQFVVFVILAGLVGVLAALRPARRAARLDVLKAISTD